MKKRKRNHKYKIEDILSGFDYTVDDFLKEQKEQALQANEAKIDDKLYEL